MIAPARRDDSEQSDQEPVIIIISELPVSPLFAAHSLLGFWVRAYSGVVLLCFPLISGLMFGAYPDDLPLWIEGAVFGVVVPVGMSWLHELSLIRMLRTGGRACIGVFWMILFLLISGTVWLVVAVLAAHFTGLTISVCLVGAVAIEIGIAISTYCCKRSDDNFRYYCAGVMTLIASCSLLAMLQLMWHLPSLAKGMLLSRLYGLSLLIPLALPLCAYGVLGWFLRRKPTPEL